MGETPGSIPNPEAKPNCADGTARGTLWESRTPPDILSRRPPGSPRVGVFVLRLRWRSAGTDNRHRDERALMSDDKRAADSGSERPRRGASPASGGQSARAGQP